MRLLLAIAGLVLPMAAQAQPNPQQVQAFANRTASLMLTIEASRRCPGLDTVERVVADKLYEFDRTALINMNGSAGAALEGMRAQFAGKPCDEPQLLAARNNGEGYARTVTASAALVLRELPKCDAIAYFERGKAWATTYKAPAGMEQHVEPLAAPLRNWASTRCGSLADSSAMLSRVSNAVAATEMWKGYGFPECVTVGGLTSWRPVCAWKAPGPEGLVVAKLCNLTTGFFKRENCAFGLDAAGNLLLTYVWSIDSASKDAVSEVALIVGGTRHATKDVKDGADQRRTWRFPASAAQALMRAARDAKVEDEAVIMGSTTTSNVPSPAGDFQDAVQLAKALRGG